MTLSEFLLGIAVGALGGAPFAYLSYRYRRQGAAFRAQAIRAYDDAMMARAEAATTYAACALMVAPHDPAAAQFNAARRYPA